jgi:hypothetical protein
MAFELEICLHNKNLPFWYIGRQFIESLLSDCISVVSNHYDFRNIRGPRLTAKLGHQSKHSLKRKDCQGLRFCLWEMLTHFPPITNIENKSKLFPWYACTERRIVTGSTGSLISKIED